MRCASWLARGIAAFALVGEAASAAEPVVCPSWQMVSEDDLAAAHELRPRRVDLIRAYLTARAAAAEGDRESALEGLKTLDRVGSTFLPGPQEPFTRWNGDAEFATIMSSLRNRFGPTENGRVAIEATTPPVTAEGIAYDAVSQRTFLSNWYDNSIYILGRDGKLERYFSLPELTPNGIAVDAANRHLWFVATDAFRDNAEEPKSVLWRIDLATGERSQFTAEGAKGFNDLAVSSFGHVYVSDTPGGEIYVLDEGAGSLRSLLKERGRFQEPNGLAVDESGRFLFVAQGLDLLTIDLYDLDVAEIALPNEIETLGTDGLYFRDGRLYAIQNFLTPGTLVEITLDQSMKRAESFRFLERGNPLFDLPTTGTFVGGEFWMMASTQLYLYGAGKVPTPEEIRPLAILAYGPCG